MLNQNKFIAIAVIVLSAGFFIIFFNSTFFTDIMNRIGVPINSEAGKVITRALAFVILIIHGFLVKFYFRT